MLLRLSGLMSVIGLMVELCGGQTLPDLASTEIYECNSARSGCSLQSQGQIRTDMRYGHFLDIVTNYVHATGETSSWLPYYGYNAYINVDGISWTYICGLDVWSRDFGDEGISKQRIVLCNKYSWGSQTIQVLWDDEKGWDQQMRCASGKFVDGIQYQYEINRGLDDVCIRCSYPDKTGAGWLCGGGRGGSWQNAYYHPTGFMMGARTSNFDGNDDMGNVAFSAGFLNFFYCSGVNMLATTTLLKEEDIDPGTSPKWAKSSSDDSDYFEVKSVILVSDVFVYTAPKYCPPISCAAYKSDCSTTAGATHVEAVTFNPLTGGSPRTLLDTEEVLSYTRDPPAEFDLTFCLKCQDIDNGFHTTLFRLKQTCTTNIGITTPDSFSADQTYDLSTTEADWPAFVFSSFYTKSSACQVVSYHISDNPSSLVDPQGVNVEAYEENPTSGTINANTFKIKILDGETPFTYQFYIRATAMGGSEFWTPLLTLTGACPSIVSLYPTTAIQTQLNSYIGADLVDDGADARYTFSEFKTVLPKCSVVTGYEIAELTPASYSITYPSLSCSSTPCFTLDFDVTAAGSFTFRVKVLTTAPAVASGDYLTSTITVVVGTSPSTPEINIPAGIVTSNAHLVDEVVTYSFPLFTCTSSSCKVSNYQLSSSPTSIVAVPGLGTPTLNYFDSVMEFTVSTTIPQTIGPVYIYSELKKLPSIFKYTTDPISFVISCGSEAVTVSGTTSFSLGPYANNGAAHTFVLSTEIPSTFQSTKSVCPLTRYEISNNPTQVQLTNPSDLSTAAFSITANGPLLQTFTLKALTGTAKENSVSFSIKVCGFEQITGSSEQKLQMSAGNTVTIGKAQYSALFSATLDSATSDAYCVSEVTYELQTGSNCDQDLSSSLAAKAALVGTDLKFDGTSDYGEFSICLVASTLGKVSASTTYTVKVCGSATLSLSSAQGHTSIDRLYQTFGLSATSTTLGIFSDEGFLFQTDDSECSLFFFSLHNADYSFFSSTSIKLEGSTPESLALSLDLASSFNSSFLVRASSISETIVSPAHDLFLKVQIAVCGSEVITVKEGSWNETWLLRQGYTVLYSKDYKSWFTIDSLECPILNFTYEPVDSFMNEFLEFISDDNIRFNTNCERCVGDRELYIKAHSAGKVVGSRLVNIKLMDENSLSVMNTSESLDQIVDLLQSYNMTTQTSCTGRPRKLTGKHCPPEWLQAQEIEVCNIVFKESVVLVEENSTATSVEFRIDPDLARPRMGQSKYAMEMNPLQLAFIFTKMEMTIESQFPNGTNCEEALSRNSSNLKQVYVHEEEVKVAKDFKINSIGFKPNSHMLVISFSKRLKPFPSKEIMELLMRFNVFRMWLKPSSAYDESELLEASLRLTYEDDRAAALAGASSEITSAAAAALGEIEHGSDGGSAVGFEWEISSLSASTIELALHLPNPQQISSSGTDELIIEVISNQVLLDEELGESMTPDSFGSRILDIPQLLLKKAQQEQMEAVAQQSLVLSLTVETANLVLNLILMKSLQDLWSIMNTQQLIILFSMFALDLPGHVRYVHSLMGIFHQSDIFPTDMIYGLVFDFSDTDSFNELFELVGFEGSNFIELSGTFPVGFFVLVVTSLGSWIVLKAATFCYKNSFFRRLGMRMTSESIGDGVHRLLFEGYLELMICTFIQANSLFYVTTYESMNPSDRIAVGLASATFAYLTVLPLAMCIFILWNGRHLHRSKVQNQLGRYYQDLKHSPIKALYHCFFLIRRGFLVVIVVVASRAPGMQLIMSWVLTLVTVLYLSVVRPFQEASLNRGEIKNEISVFLLNDVLIVLSNQSMSAENRDGTGWLYIAFLVVIFGGNILTLAKGLLWEALPQFYLQLRSKWEQYQYAEWRQKKFAFVEKMAARDGDGEAFPSHKASLAYYKDLVAIERTAETKAQLEEQIQDVIAQQKWLKNHDLPSDFLAFELSEVKAQLKKVKGMNKRKKFRPEEFATASLADYIRLGPSNMVAHHYPYHDSVSRGLARPYNELALEQVISAYVASCGCQSEDELSKAQKEACFKRILIENKSRLDAFLGDLLALEEKPIALEPLLQPFSFCRAVAERVKGEQARAGQVFSELSLVLSSKCVNLEEAEQLLEGKAAKYRTEVFQTTADLYRVPIIYFSHTHRMAFFDKEFWPKGAKDLNTVFDPLYFVDKLPPKPPLAAGSQAKTSDQKSQQQVLKKKTSRTHTKSSASLSILSSQVVQAKTKRRGKSMASQDFPALAYDQAPLPPSQSSTRQSKTKIPVEAPSAQAKPLIKQMASSLTSRSRNTKLYGMLTLEGHKELLEQINQAQDESGSDEDLKLTIARQGGEVQPIDYI